MGLWQLYQFLWPVFHSQEWICFHWQIYSRWCQECGFNHHTSAPRWLCPWCFSGSAPWEQTDMSIWHRLEFILPWFLPYFLLSSFSPVYLFISFSVGIVTSWMLGDSCKDGAQRIYGAKGVKSKILQAVQGCTACLEISQMKNSLRTAPRFMFQREPCISIGWVTEEKWQGFILFMKSPTNNVKVSISTSFLLVSVAPGRGHWPLAVNCYHQCRTRQSHTLTDGSTQTSGITFPEVLGFLCRYREKHNVTGFCLSSAEISSYSCLGGSLG